MGIDIVTYPIMDGIAVINDVYGHVRDIRITKEDDYLYRVDCVFHIFKNINNINKIVDSIHISKKYSDDFLTKTWNDIYNLVKEYLNSIGITYTDNI